MKPLFENPSEPTKPVEFTMEHNFHILGSCNGLLCVFDNVGGYVKLLNPSIGFESKKSPTIDCYDKDMFIPYHGYGFGYDHVNDKYKVLVRVRRAFSRFIEFVTKIYTFGENSWTTIHSSPCFVNNWNGQFVSGTLNWIIFKRGVSSNRRTTILAFDLEKETYNEMMLPEHHAPKVIFPSPVIGVWNNRLCVCLDYNKTHWDIWLMKTYGVAESWIRLVMIPQTQFLIHEMMCSSIELLFILEDDIVLMVTPFKLVSYNLNNGRLNYPSLSSGLGWVQHIYQASLVSPRC
jgi:F-box interacting protein